MFVAAGADRGGETTNRADLGKLVRTAFRRRPIKACRGLSALPVPPFVSHNLSPAPVPKHAVTRSSGYVIRSGCDQLSATQMGERHLDCALR